MVCFKELVAAQQWEEITEKHSLLPHHWTESDTEISIVRRNHCRVNNAALDEEEIKGSQHPIYPTGVQDFSIGEEGRGI